MGEFATDTRHMALKMLSDLRADRYVARAFGHQLASIERAVRIGGPDDRYPSYNGLLIIAQSVCGALSRAGITDCDDPGEAIDVMRTRLESRITALEAVQQAGEDDTRRLNWLATNPRGANIMVDGEAKPCIFWGVSSAPNHTLREAIDAAASASAARQSKDGGANA
ncbi:hypothetical protein LJR168_001983 [Pseudoxanthomonas sp. LjRoot168]|uniref:hypothetical protein n=1 Tax=unclassified Pseudoxanthomonas TaxID=2645906 RepID=UPI003ED086BB